MVCMRWHPYVLARIVVRLRLVFQHVFQVSNWTEHLNVSFWLNPRKANRKHKTSAIYIKQIYITPVNTVHPFKVIDLYTVTDGGVCVPSGRRFDLCILV